jgi:hypothetical protein
MEGWKWISFIQKIDKGRKVLLDDTMKAGF